MWVQIALAADVPIGNVVGGEVPDMKWIARSIVFAAALAVGLAAAWVWPAIGAAPASAPHIQPAAAVLMQARDEPGRYIAPGEITVVFTGIGRDEKIDGRVYLRFLVHNRSYSPASYRAFSADSPFPQVSANGKTLRFGFRCGTGMMEHTIPPWGIAEFRVGYWDYLEEPASGSTMEVGFVLKPSSEIEGALYSSEPFTLPEEFRQSAILSN